MSRYHTDFAFIGIGGVTPRGEICDFSRAAAELRSRMLLASDVPCVVADHTKFGRNTGVTIKHFDQAAWLITDMAPEPELGAALKECGTKLLIA
ncbi:hypothetical protein N234_31400 [Ralstonia pickettii DTP0602]|nr:hypothetical protein N234_31400 [Ralstonia pickettii DTP0602]